MDAETLLKYFNQEYMARPVEEKEMAEHSTLNQKIKNTNTFAKNQP